jgi:hypothetical protein
LTKEPKAYMEEKTATSTNGAGKICTILKLDTYLSHCINSIWVKDLKFGKTIENTLKDTSIDNYFLNTTPNFQKI